MYGYVIFTDIEKYSALKDADLKIFFNKIIPVIFEELKTYKESAIIWNTWGDAIFAIYDKAETAINMALAYREAFNKIDFESFGIKKLNPRIAGNFGEFELAFDPVSGKSNVHGTLVNITARIEPVTTPGEIFVTKEFRDMSISSYDKVDNVRFEDMGEIKLPKNAGALNLYRLCKRAETLMKPAGFLIPNIDYNIQAPIKNPEFKSSEKSIEQRLNENLNKKVSSDEKLNRIANSLKEEKPLKIEKTNFITNLIQNFKTDKNSQINKNFKTNKNSKNSKNFQGENPFFIALLIFIFAMVTNFILETNFSKNLFNYIGYYFNLTLYNINMSALNPFAKPEFIASLNPWMWLRSFVISSFIVGRSISFFQKKVLKFKNIVIVPFIVVLLYLCLYVLPNNYAPSTLFFMQNFYMSIFLLWLACTAGVSML